MSILIRWSWKILGRVGFFRMNPGFPDILAMPADMRYIFVNEWWDCSLSTRKAPEVTSPGSGRFFLHAVFASEKRFGLCCSALWYLQRGNLRGDNVNPFCCREEELRKLNKRYAGDWFKCIGLYRSTWVRSTPTGLQRPKWEDRYGWAWPAPGVRIGIRKRYGLSLLYLFQGRLYGGTAQGAGARRGSAGNVVGALSINQPSGMLYATAGGMF